jgi:hypothetical protein
VLALASLATCFAQTRLSGPFTHDNLTIFLIHGADKSAKNLLTLDEAIDQRKVVVYETRNVNELAVENVSSEDVFIESGDIVKGGAQDRTLKDDIILPSKSGKVSLNSFCESTAAGPGAVAKMSARLAKRIRLSPPRISRWP